MNILVTGGAGFIGTHLRSRLINAGHSVRVIDNLHGQVHGLAPQIDLSDCEFVYGDVRDEDAVSRAVAGCDVVFHLAAETGVGQSQYEIARYISTNTLGTAVVLQKAAAAGVRKVVIASSRAVYGEGMHDCPECALKFPAEPRMASDLENGFWDVRCPNCNSTAEARRMKESDPGCPVSIYGMTKVQQEQIGRMIGSLHSLDVTIVRPFNVYGPGQSMTNPYVGVLGTFFRLARSEKQLEIYEDGRMRRDFVYVGDVAEILTRVCETPLSRSIVINIGTGVAITLKEIAEELFKILGIEPRLAVTGKYRVGDIHHAVADTSALKEVLDFIPQTSFQMGFREFISWAADEQTSESDIDRLVETELLNRNLLKQAGK